ncbi:MAG: glycoside hydrolase family 6 protein [Jatrophihabitans sp.]|uniref:glycoside hydrolase family 6 protein n=1 Tax=Jatrophihabitans sp. TaxID=1932789 RepID=UPI003F7DD809
MRLRRRWSALLLVPALVAAALTATSVAGGTAPAAAASVPNPTDPLRGPHWGVYTGNTDNIWPAYTAATGTTRTLLGRIALRPRVRWFGSWSTTDSIADMIHQYVLNAQHGDPNTLVQLAIFRLWPYGEGAANRAWSAADQAAYRGWIDAAARGIGGSRVAIILEPDEGVALPGWRPDVKEALVRYAAWRFAALPRATTYLEASAPDWLRIPQAVAMLKASGIQYVRGFALNATHYDTTAANVRYGRNLVIALHDAGVAWKHFVVNTADNGRGFTWQQYWAAHPHGDFDNAETCTSRTQQRCVTLGVPPTTDVANPRWGLPSTVAGWAAKWCDGYLWYGRPWLVRQAAPWDQRRALAVASTTPY